MATHNSLSADTRQRLLEAEARARMQSVETDVPVAMPLGDAIAELLRRRLGGVTAGQADLTGGQS